MASDSNPTDRSSQLGPGVKINDRYVIERELGRGGMGVVYVARDERLHGMPVVIKFLLDYSSQSSWLAKKFLQEAEALTRINHPGVVRVIDRDRTNDGKPFFVMEFIKGRSLRSVMTPEGLALDYAAALVRQIGQSLGAAHREGVVHRDLKPENIMLEALGDGDEHVKLIDFGIAKLRDSQSGTATDVMVVAGSINYMSPEQFAGQPVSAAGDVYAFGIIAYELITGRRPFNPDAQSQVVAMQQLVTMQRAEQIIAPRQLRPSLSDAAQAILLSALRCEPDSRPQDAKQFGEELARALTGGTATFDPTLVLDNSRSTVIVAVPAAATVADPVSAPTAVSVVPARPATTIAPAEAPAVKRPIGSLPVLAGAAAVLAIGAAAAYFFSGRAPAPVDRPATVATASPSAPAVTTPERSLIYSVTLRQDPRLHPGSKPFRLPGEIIFSPGDLVRFSFSSPQTGFLYIVNESPTKNRAATLFNILFPSPTSNDGTARLEAGRQVQIPERGEGFVLDAEEGVEKLWLVWSGDAISGMDALKRWANPRDKGEVKDQADAAWIREFLAAHATPTPAVLRNDESRQTTLTARGAAFVKLVTLEHHQ